MQISVYEYEECFKRRIIVGILMVLLLMQSTVIVYFSSQTAEQSGNISRAVMEKLDWLPQSIPREKTNPETFEITLHYIVRKVAHLYNFFFIGCVLYAIRRNFEKATRYDFLWICYGILVAVLDEIHQKFVPGRSGMFSDVFVDISGVLLGYMFVCLLFHVIFSKRCAPWKKKLKRK